MQQHQLLLDHDVVLIRTVAKKLIKDAAAAATCPHRTHIGQESTPHHTHFALEPHFWRNSHRKVNISEKSQTTL